jgi:hypothetical protein
MGPLGVKKPFPPALYLPPKLAADNTMPWSATLFVKRQRDGPAQTANNPNRLLLS